MWVGRINRTSKGRYIGRIVFARGETARRDWNWPRDFSPARLRCEALELNAAFVDHDAACLSEIPSSGLKLKIKTGDVKHSR
jgi:hypothetical protein